MIVLDTTVLAYATGLEHPLLGPCRELLDRIGQREVPATTTVEVIQEFAHVRSRRDVRSRAVTLGRRYVDLLTPLLPVGEGALLRGLALYESVDRLGGFDSVLAAAALESRADALVSADRAFGDVPGLVHVFPDAAGVASLVGLDR